MSEQGLQVHKVGSALQDQRPQRNPEAPKPRREQPGDHVYSTSRGCGRIPATKTAPPPRRALRSSGEKQGQAAGGVPTPSTAERRRAAARLPESPPTRPLIGSQTPGNPEMYFKESPALLYNRRARPRQSWGRVGWQERARGVRRASPGFPHLEHVPRPCGDRVPSGP